MCETSEFPYDSIVETSQNNLKIINIITDKAYGLFQKV